MGRDMNGLDLLACCWIALAIGGSVVSKMGSMKLREFRERLQRLSFSDAERPFVCDGDPYQCTAFLVGYNPASLVPFWPFWSDATGFDKSMWFDCYRAYRMAEPLKEGRTRRQPISSTRQRIEWIIEAAKPVRVLETNLYPRATKKASDLAAEDRQAEALTFMLREIGPRVLLLHGKKVVEAFQARYRQPLTDTFTSMFIEGQRMIVGGVRHLSRGVSRSRATELG
jgi:hypothetical protein